jgi:tRNA pseudouridine55 synthase
MSDQDFRDGALRVDKPSGPTSHDIVVEARKALSIRRIGHTGTLDPLASGLLLLCVGGATRIVEFLTSLDKTYLATLRLGQTTDSDDTEGDVLEDSTDWEGLTLPRIEGALDRFRGRMVQVPPRLSAKKRGGEPLHRKVRRGEDVSPDPVQVEIHELDLLETRLPEVHLRVSCSSGTYIRALARDLGTELGVGAHLAKLRRTRIGPFRVEDAVPVHDFGRNDVMSRAWLTPAQALCALPSIDVSQDEAAHILQGRSIPMEPRCPEGRPVAVVLGERLLAVAVRETDRLKPRKVFPLS